MLAASIILNVILLLACIALLMLYLDQKTQKLFTPWSELESEIDEHMYCLAYKIEDLEKEIKLTTEDQLKRLEEKLKEQLGTNIEASIEKPDVKMPDLKDLGRDEPKNNSSSFEGKHQKFFDLREQGKTLEEISEMTGLSMDKVRLLNNLK